MAKKKKQIIEDRILVDDISSRAGEAYQRLQVNIDLASVKDKKKIIGITSSTKSEGKSTTLVNLANIYAKKGKKVIIIDLDLRRPTIHFYFRKPNETGIVDYVLGEIQKEDLIIHTNENIDFINCGKHTPFPAEVLESEKLAELINELKKEYDYIFLDCPPILVAADTTIISKFLDGIIIVVKENYATKDMLSETVRTLRNCKVNIIGAVMTNVTVKDAGYYSYEGEDK